MFNLIWARDLFLMKLLGAEVEISKYYRMESLPQGFQQDKFEESASLAQSRIFYETEISCHEALFSFNSGLDNGVKEWKYNMPCQSKTSPWTYSTD